MIVEKERLWTKVITNKHVRGEFNVTKLRKKQASSNIWRGVVAASSILSKG